MKIEQIATVFTPVTITLENKDELDYFHDLIKWGRDHSNNYEVVGLGDEILSQLPE